MEQNHDPNADYICLPITGEANKELKQIRKTLRKRIIATITLSLCMAAIMLAATVFGIVPWVESLYWNPGDTSYGDNTDLELTIHAYTELFGKGHDLVGVEYTQTGFASWSLSIPFTSSSYDDATICTGTLEKNQLRLDPLWNFSRKNVAFGRWRQEKTTPEPRKTEATTQLLEELPEYIHVEATVDFTEDMSMEALLDFHRKHPELHIIWVAVRCAAPDGQWTPICGMAPFSGGTIYNGLYEDYPNFQMTTVGAEQLEQHFMSLLQYSADRVEAGRGLARYNDPRFYTEFLEYVQENGVYTYGCIVAGSPTEIKELMGDNSVSGITLIDGWINLDWQDQN